MDKVNEIETKEMPRINKVGSWFFEKNKQDQ
jgi:hypothetical protein